MDSCLCHILHKLLRLCVCVCNEQLDIAAFFVKKCCADALLTKQSDYLFPWFTEAFASGVQYTKLAGESAAAAACCCCCCCCWRLIRIYWSRT